MLARYEELQDLIAILGMEELSISDQQIVIRARRCSAPTRLSWPAFPASQAFCANR